MGLFSKNILAIIIKRTRAHTHSLGWLKTIIASITFVKNKDNNCHLPISTIPHAITRAARGLWDLRCVDRVLRTNHHRHCHGHQSGPRVLRKMLGLHIIYSLKIAPILSSTFFRFHTAWALSFPDHYLHAR